MMLRSISGRIGTRANIRLATCSMHHQKNSHSESANSTSSSHLVKTHAINVLKQTQKLVEVVSDLDYIKPMQKFYNASIGSHARHILQHFETACSGEEMLKYDARQRNTAIETDKLLAIASIKKLIHKIEEMHLCYSTHVTVEFMANDEESFDIKSNIMRELAFVAHHGMHHISTMKVMSESMGYHFDDATLGMAPATVKAHKQH